MVKFVDRIIFWFKNSRPYTVPITFLSWLVIFVYSLKYGGNLLSGLIAYFGIAIVHLVTNLADDYFDYIRLSKDQNFINSAKDSKCRYLKQGLATLGELKIVIILMLLIAALIGLYLFINSGFLVGIFALAGLIIALFYSKFSSKGLGDFAVILAYGPFMYEGVYYVMTEELSYEVLILSLACGIFVDSILFASMILDYDEDYNSGKMTFCTRLNSKKYSLLALFMLYILGFVLIGYFSYINHNFYCLFSLVILPLIFSLMNSLCLYNEDKTFLPEIRFWYYPLENWHKLKSDVCAPYFLRFFFARNISVWFLLIVSIAIYIK